MKHTALTTLTDPLQGLHDFVLKTDLGAGALVEAEGVVSGDWAHVGNKVVPSE